MDKGREQPESPGRQRLDKWLFFARLAKSRAIAQKWIVEEMVLVNGAVATQPSLLVKAGDRIDLLSWKGMTRREHGLFMRLPGDRRGPYEEARLLYEDLGWRDVEDI